MNCREAQSRIFAERDDALDTSQRAALEAHVAQCGDCQRIRDDLTTALTTWRNNVNRVAVPNPEREWHSIRRKIRGGVEAGEAPRSPARRNLFAWIALPLGAAAAVAVALFVALRPAPTAIESVKPIARIAHANSVEVPGDKASTVVFVDDKSGWLFVWASAPTPNQG
jgi:hypothetical protein